MYNRIDLPLAPSALTGWLAAAPWLVLATVVVALTLSGHWPAALMLPVLAAGARSHWRRCGSLDHPHAVQRLVTRGPRLSVTLTNGRQEEVRVSAGSRITGRFLVLALAGAATGRRYPVVVLSATCSGSAEREALRRLRVWLRLMPEPPAPINTGAWYTNPLQRFWPGGKTHDH